jgi:flagellar basal-body rod protein FlgF
MDRLIYTSLTAMRGSMARQTAIAHNLANANTPGFRADLAEAQTLWLESQQLNTRAFASEEVQAADMKAGTIVATGRDLDIALSGDGMLAVQAENGEIGYTRRGDLMLSSTGLLTTGDGRPVQGTQGPLTLPQTWDAPIDLKAQIEGIELERIQTALGRADGVISEAARLLTLKRTTLIEKMRKYDVDRVVLQ